MRHPALPQKFTVEQLAQWFTENAIDKRIHTDEIPLTDAMKHEHEVKITQHTAALYDLKELEKEFKTAIQKGTPWEHDQRQPQNFTIPPTKGTKELEANRQFSDKILKQGFTTVDTELYGIPFEKRVIYFTIEGAERDASDMNPEQLAAHGQLFDKAVAPMKKVIEDLNKKGVQVSFTSSPLDQ